MSAGDEVAMEQRLNQYKSLDYSFPTCRECQFIEKLVAVILILCTYMYTWV